MKKNLILLFFTIIFSIIFIEFILSISGKYKNLTKNKLKPSDAIYERPSLSMQNNKHPDLNHIIVNTFDKDGVKNFNQTPTSQKKNIIGIFGDSMTENITVDPKFEFTSLINKKLNNHTIVNYGIGGYSADQSFIRYLKYKDHDLKHVFLFLLPGDEGFSTKSTFSDNGEYKIHKTKLSIFYQIIGKLNLTYFVLDSFYNIRYLLKRDHAKIDAINYNSVLANKINRRFYNKDLIHCHLTPNFCEKNLSNLLKIFKKEVEKNNAKFHILVFPEDNYISYLSKIIKDTGEDFNFYILDKKLNVVRTELTRTSKELVFINDAHWNEYGNLAFANNLLNIFNKIGIKLDSLKLNITTEDIDFFYNKNK